jgi:hypothetical protein
MAAHPFQAMRALGEDLPGLWQELDEAIRAVLHRRGVECGPGTVRLTQRVDLGRWGYDLYYENSISPPQP